MPDRQPRYVLSQRAAEALRPLIQAGTRLAARPRQIRDVGGGSDSLFFLQVKIVPGDNGPQVAVCVGGEIPPNALLVNGYQASVDTQGQQDGWKILGLASTIRHVWLVPEALPAAGSGDPAGVYYAATNWSPAEKVSYTFSTAAWPQPPTGASGNDWSRWLHPILLAEIFTAPDGSYRVMQCNHGGMDVSIEVGDADGTHSGPPNGDGFCSVEQYQARQLQLFNFREANGATAGNVTNGVFDLVLRCRDQSGVGMPGSAKIDYCAVTDLVDAILYGIEDKFAEWFSHEVSSLLDELAAQNDVTPKFWATGGNHTTCHGSDIGNNNNQTVVDLDGRQLTGGAWSAAGDFEAAGQLSGATLKVAGDVYVPAQITYLDANNTPQTITVLKKQ